MQAVFHRLTTWYKGQSRSIQTNLRATVLGLATLLLLQITPQHLLSPGLQQITAALTSLVKIMLGVYLALLIVHLLYPLVGPKQDHPE